jgi:hypothetical protein
MRIRLPQPSFPSGDHPFSNEGKSGDGGRPLWLGIFAAKQHIKDRDPAKCRKSIYPNPDSIDSASRKQVIMESNES